MSTVHKVMQLWRPGQYIKPHDAGPRIGHLFGAGQQGGVYLFDKAHQASAFQGSAYATPLSAVEQFIGSFYDLSGNANHYSQTTSTARSKWSARVNLHVRTEQFSNAYWDKTTGVSVSPGAITSPTGGLADTLAYDGSGLTGSYRLYGGVTLHPAGVSFTQYIMLRSVSGATTVRIGGNVSGGGFLVCNLTTEWQKFQISGVSNGSSVVQLLIYSDVGNNDPFTIGVWGASCTYTADAHLPYQWVNTATDYDTAGFPPYLLPDGADDYYTSASGGGSTTGIFICAAIAPRASGAKQIIWSDDSGNTGYELCINASNQVEFSAGTGSARVSCVSAALTLGAPKVITAQHDGTNLTVRVDGVATTAACGAASAGTAGTTLLRANGAASNYAKVQVNGFLQRHGAQPSAELLTFAERFMANLQGRTL